MSRAFSIVVVCLVGALAIFLVRDHLGGNVFRLDPSISYAADFSFQFNSEGFGGRTRHTPGTTRTEFEINGVSVVSLELWDEDRTYLILPEFRQYAWLNRHDRNRALARLRQIIGKFEKHIQAVGTEKHEGLQVTKYRMRVPGGRFRFWVTDEGLLVRLEGEGEAGGERLYIEYSLSNIQVGPQNPANFRLPKGYRRVPSVKHFRR